MRRSAMILVLCLVCGAQTVHASDGGANLLKYIPDDANVIGVIRVAGILASPRAKAEGWAERQQEQFLAGAALVPPWVETVAIGAHTQPGMEPAGWTVMLLQRPKPVQMALVAEHEKSTVEQIAGHDVVFSARGAYFVGIPRDVIAIRSPAFRQDTARWIRSISRERESSLSPYLIEAAASAEHIVLAIETRDMADPQRLRERLQASPALSGASIDAVHRLLLGLRGVRFTATVTDQTLARFWFDFSEPPAADAEFIKSLFLEFLNDQGALLPDLAEATADVSGRSVVLAANLSDDSLRRILSLLTLPNLEHAAESPEATQPEGQRAEGQPESQRIRSAEHDVRSSLRYLTAIERMLADLKRSLQRAKEYERTAKWHETFAEKLDRLPIAGVDPELLEYGGRVSSHLRGVAASLRGQAVEVNTQQRSVTWNVSVDPGYVAASWWGGAGYRAPTWHATSNLEQVRQQQAEAISRGAEQRLGIWQIIDDETAAIRRSMSHRYGAAFD